MLNLHNLKPILCHMNLPKTKLALAQKATNQQPLVVL